MHKIFINIFLIFLLASSFAIADHKPDIRNGGNFPNYYCGNTRQGWGGMYLNANTPTGVRPILVGTAGFPGICNDYANTMILSEYSTLQAPYGLVGDVYGVFYTRKFWGGWNFSPASPYQFFSAYVQTIPSPQAGQLCADNSDIIATRTWDISQGLGKNAAIAFFRPGWGAVYVDMISSFGQQSHFELSSWMIQYYVPNASNSHLVVVPTSEFTCLLAFWKDGWTQAIWLDPARSDVNNWPYTGDCGYWSNIP